jgi:predicted ester cyclase
MSDQTRDENRRSVEKLFETGFNQGDLAVLDELVSPEYVGSQGEKGPAGFRGIAVGLRAAFPDIHYTLDDAIAEGDRVAVRWHWTGTHTGKFRTYPPTGKLLTNTGAAIFRLKDGKIAAASLETDRLGFLMQVGALPSAIVPVPRPAPAAK